METIPNIAGRVAVEITIPLGVLCEVAGEPQPGSTLTWRYTADAGLLTLNACRSWPATQMDKPLDLETFTRRASDEAAMALGVPVEAIGHYILMGAILQCRSSTVPAGISDSPR